MKPALVLLAALSAAAPATAETVVAARTIRAMTILSPEDLALHPSQVPGGFSSPSDLVGLETKVALYPGRPIRAVDVGAPAMVERNQIVTLSYSVGGLDIRVEARSLSRAGVGERIRVMNIASRTTVFGMVQPDGSVSVTQ